MRYCIYSFLILSLWGCVGESPEKKTIVGDGIHSDQPLYPENFWSLSEKPRLTIGVDEGAPEYQLYRSYDAVKLESGYLVPNAGTQELRFYDKKGKFQSSVGQLGRGPGDFSDLSSMYIVLKDGNSFAVRDAGNDRVQIFDLGGEVLEVLIKPRLSNTGASTILDLFDQNNLFIWAVVGSAVLRGEPGNTLDPMKVELLRHNTHNSTTTTLVEAVDRQRYVNEFEGRTHYPFIPFQPELLYEVRSDKTLLYSKGDQYRISVIDSSGSILENYSWNLPLRTSDSIWDEYLDIYNAEDFPFYHDFLMETPPYPEYLPALSEMKSDTEGNIWVKRYKALTDDPNIWDVLSPEGQWLGSVEMPQDFTLSEIGHDYILGRTRTNGFEQVQEYSLNKDYN